MPARWVETPRGRLLTAVHLPVYVGQRTLGQSARGCCRPLSEFAGSRSPCSYWVQQLYVSMVRGGPLRAEPQSSLAFDGSFAVCVVSFCVLRQRLRWFHSSPLRLPKMAGSQQRGDRDSFTESVEELAPKGSRAADRRQLS